LRSMGDIIHPRKLIDRGLTPPVPPVKEKGKRIKVRGLPRHNGTQG